MSFFLNAAMLAGLAGLAIPTAIHLLNRSRYQVVSWGAMMFLEFSKKERRRYLRLKNLILLVVRSLLLLFFVLALTRPVLRAPAVLPGLKGTRSAAIILDCSYSMGASTGARTRLEEAKDVALDVTSTLTKGDRATVLPAGHTDEITCPEFETDLALVASKVRDARLGHGRADLPRALGAALDRLDSAETVGRELYVITDSQGSSWRSSVQGALEALGARLRESRHGPAIFVVQVGEEAPNAAIVSVDIPAPVVQAGRSMPVAVRIANYGSSPRETQVRLLADGELAAVSRVGLEPGAVETVRFRHVFPAPGYHLLAAEISPDLLGEDDRFSLSTEALDYLPVLLVNGDPRQEALKGETGFLRLALEPRRFAGRGGRSGGDRDLFKVTEVTAAELARTELASCRVVVLANVPVLTERDIERIEDFVREGGGLFLAPGDMVRATGYNSFFWKDGEGLSPGALDGPESPPDGPEFPGAVAAHPVFGFSRTAKAGAPRIAIHRRFRLAEDRLADGAGVLMRTSSGGPLLLERRFGRGRVMLSAIPLDADWSDLPHSTFYVPFVWSALSYLASEAAPPRNVSVGEPLAAWIEGRQTLTDAKVVPPRGEPVRVEIRSGRRRDSVVYDRTDEPGIYTLEIHRTSGKEASHFVVAMPRDESDLRALTKEEVEAVEDALGARFVRTSGELRELVRSVRTGSELWRPLIALAVALACLEVLLAARWGGGSSGSRRGTDG